MNCVSLVCTVHEGKGLANVSELREILERIRPEVIFVEIPPAAFNEYFKICCRENLESKAVRQYRQRHQVEIVPVDLHTPDEDFFQNNQYLFEWIEEKSHEYRRLVDTHSVYVRAYGFPYLNSGYCTKLWADLYEDLLNTIRGSDDARLLKLYELWLTTNDRRDRAMVENVLEYCEKNVFDRGVFLVGASHRQSIMDKARTLSAVGTGNIQWDFAGNANLTTQENDAPEGLPSD